VPDPAVLAADCDPAVLAVFETARALAVAAGAELVEVELAPFLAAGALLYQGPWLAERYAAVGEFVAAHPHDVHPVVAELLAPGARISGAAVFGAIDRLRTLRRATAGTWRRIDALMLPTVPRTFSVAEMLADPIRLNARLGRYTTFVNLLDLAAVAVPVGFAAGLPFGVTVIGPAGYDLPLARLGADLHARSGLLAGAGSHPLSVAGL
jgi:Asp-tRNA(Asn)/Glu-tRNA(Gln) amidotransferase A subunit family amidase